MSAAPDATLEGLKRMLLDLDPAALARELPPGPGRRNRPLLLRFLRRGSGGRGRRTGIGAAAAAR